MRVQMRINGERREDDIDPRTLLVHYIRDIAGLTGTQCPLRNLPVRRVHSTSQRQRGEILHDPCRPGRGRRNHDDRLSKLIPGCEKLETLGPDEYSGTINVGVASVGGIYSGKLKIEDQRPPEHYRMLVDGKGKQGFMRGSGTLDLGDDGAKSTIMKYSGDVQVGGPLIQVGQRVIESAAKMMLGQFFAAADAELRAEAVGTVARQGILINLWRSILRLFAGFLAQKNQT